jgi:hypothetical protein
VFATLRPLAHTFLCGRARFPGDLVEKVEEKNIDEGAHVNIMDDFASDTDSDYTSYWRDWVSISFLSSQPDTRKKQQVALSAWRAIPRSAIHHHPVCDHWRHPLFGHFKL